MPAETLFRGTNDMMETVRISGTGSYLPPKILRNTDLQKMGLNTTDEWITKRTGVQERRIADDDTAASDLGFKAALNALETASLPSSSLDMIIFATITPDTSCPSASNWLQAKLGATQAVTFDIAAACSGFIFALNVAEQYLKNRACSYILVVASEIMTRTLNWSDRSTCILWGDGAGAAVLTLGETGHEILSTHIHTDGASGQDLLLPGGGSKTTPISHESVDRGLHHLKMVEAKYSFRVAVKHFMEAISEAASYHHIDIHDIAWFIPHQANIRMFRHIAHSMKIPFNKFYMNIHKYGNISSASCAIALDEAVRDGSIQKDDMVCLPVFGGGLTWGSALIKW
jgi:3-oxoacyl-[acyl-carrier-protein] synthase-3